MILSLVTDGGIQYPLTEDLKRTPRLGRQAEEKAPPSLLGKGRKSNARLLADP